MTDVLRTKALKRADSSDAKRTERLAELYAKPFASLSAEDKDFLLQEIAVRLGLRAPHTDAT